MNKETVEISIILFSIILLGALAIWASRWSRKKRIEFLNSEDSKICRENQIEGQTIIEQIKSKETWSKVSDLFALHDPKSNKAKAIKYAPFEYFGWLPQVIAAIIFALTIIVIILVDSLFR